MTSMQEEIQAAALEGIAPMPEDLIGLRNEKILLDKEIERLEGRKKEIVKIFDDRLKADGLKAFSLYGKNHATASEFFERRIDTKLLREEMPHVFIKYAPQKERRRVVIN